MKNQNYKIGELLEMVKSGKIVRENLQRTPSHDLKTALKIIDSVKNGRYAGVLTFAEMENGKLSILDGSSRLQDFEDFTSDKIFSTENVTQEEKDDNGKVIKTTKYKINNTFSNLTEMEKNQFLEYVFPCIILENVAENDRAINFVNINSSVALSTIQKNKGNMCDKLLEMVEITKNSNIMNKVFSKRLLQKDEAVAMVYNIIANLYDCYNANNGKMVNSVNSLDLSNLDLIKYANILYLFDDIEIDMNKYCLISHIVNLYNANIEIEKLEKFDNRVVYAVVTAGANSQPANDKRLEKSMQILSKTLGLSLKTGKPVKKADTEKVVTLEEIAE